MPNLIQLAVPAFLLLVALEAIADAVMRRDHYELKDTAASLMMGVGNLFVSILAKAVQFSIFALLHRWAIFHIAYQWWAWLLIFFADDCTYYWYHRISHRCRIFWASHVVHHSSQRYNLSTALRQTWTGNFMSFIFWLWMPLVGFPPAMIMSMGAISLLYQFWIHTELVRSAGPLELIFNTPAHHRVHHACNPKYIDRNHGGTLIIWDRLFGTFEVQDPDETPRFGLTKNIHTYNPVRIAFHEWADMWRDVWRASGWHNKLLYVFGNPGWRDRAPMATSQKALVASRRRKMRFEYFLGVRRNATFSPVPCVNACRETRE
jgi:sterol desaturase/sphingolipid hydroxylase (fatty acid hydroxylase superfamily)